MLAPILEKVEESLKDQLKVYKLNTDENSQTAQKYQITGIPCCILFKNGEEIHRIVGFKSQDVLETEIKQHL